MRNFRSRIVRPTYSNPPPERIDPLNVPVGVLSYHLKKYEYACERIRGGSVLDVACGIGYGSQRLGLVADTVTGVDVSVEAISAARSRYASERVTFEIVDVERGLPFDDEEFDAVVCFEAVEHLREPKVLVEEIRRVLRGEGVFILSTPRPGSGGDPTLNPHHHHQFDLESLRALVAPHFREIQILGQRRLSCGAQTFVLKMDPLKLRRLKVARPLARLVARGLGTKPAETAGPEHYVIDEFGAGRGTDFVMSCLGRMSTNPVVVDSL